MSLDNINLYPKGLIQLLGIKSGGISPSRLSAELQTQMDMLPFYLSGRLVQESTFTAAAVAGNNAVVTVPAGEQWLVTNISGQISGLSVAAQLIADTALGFSGQIGSSFIGHTAIETLALGIGRGVGVVTVPNILPLIGAPGDTYQCQLNHLSAGTATIACTVTHLKIQL